jgi:hypothetical protein
VPFTATLSLGVVLFSGAALVYSALLKGKEEGDDDDEEADGGKKEKNCGGRKITWQSNSS